ncbi:hypothetical protein GQ53DRAFT_334223 [Thozetella sp. PMI_491]|nr:hypothetical protein GQ53DRAFT_334223 [Thozetella sp. PMI_491]
MGPGRKVAHQGYSGLARATRPTLAWRSRLVGAVDLMTTMEGDSTASRRYIAHDICRPIRPAGRQAGRQADRRGGSAGVVFRTKNPCASAVSAFPLHRLFGCLDPIYRGACHEGTASGRTEHHGGKPSGRCVPGEGGGGRRMDRPDRRPQWKPRATRQLHASFGPI